MSQKKQQVKTFPAPSYKLAVVGCGGVGKSALTLHFVQGYFVTDYDPTIEDSYVKECLVDGVRYRLNVLDTAGQEVFQTMKDTFMKSSEGFLLVFSFADKQSFESIKPLHKQILRVKDRDAFPMVLVGNKCDIPHDMRAVSSVEGKNLARELRLHYIETSAKLNMHVEQVFHDTVRLVRRFYDEERHQPVMKPKKKKQACTVL